MKTFLAMFILSIVCTVSRPVDAREMTLDDNGCHRDGIYGKYHCHEGKYADQSFDSADDYPGVANSSPMPAQDLPIKLNKSGACITPDSVVYNRQKKYWLYHSVKQCLRDGGHLDRTLVLRQ